MNDSTAHGYTHLAIGNTIIAPSIDARPVFRCTMRDRSTVVCSGSRS